MIANRRFTTAMMPLSFTCLIVILSVNFGVVSSNEHYVSVECIDNCNITGAEINGGEGDSITLKYVITTNFVVFDLKYNGTTILQIISYKLILSPRPSFIDLSNTNLTNTTIGYSFSFKVINLNTSVHQGTIFSYVLSLGTPDEKNSSTINVLYRPNLVGRLESSYEVQENRTLDVNITLSGNPKPKVTAIMENKHFSLGTTSAASPYIYNAKLKDVKRSQCGKNLTLEALGYKGKISYITNVNVSFMPSAPKISSATFTSEKCLNVNWEEIVSGACSVKYTLLYTYGKHDRNSTENATYSTFYKHCFDKSFNTNFLGTVRVQAEVGGRLGYLSQPKSVVVLVSSADMVRYKWSIYIFIAVLIAGVFV